jgi:hypothetical protein
LKSGEFMILFIEQTALIIYENGKVVYQAWWSHGVKQLEKFNDASNRKSAVRFKTFATLLLIPLIPMISVYASEYIQSLTE